MVRILRKVVGKTVVCPNCGNELAFVDWDEKYYSNCNESKYIYCVCSYYIRTRNEDGTIAKGVTLITADATDEADNE